MTHSQGMAKASQVIAQRLRWVAPASRLCLSDGVTDLTLAAARTRLSIRVLAGRGPVPSVLRGHYV